MLKYAQSNYLLGMIFAFAVFFASCKDDPPEALPQNQDGNFFPLSAGNTWTYQVDSVFYDGFTLESDTFQFRVRNTVFDTFRDNLGRLAHVVLRERDTGTGWITDRQFTIVKTEDVLEVIDKDVRVVKMIFPVRTFKRWDGNAHNKTSSEDFRYKNIDMTVQVLDTSYDSTVLVIEDDYSNVLEDFYKTSLYARNLGLVEFYHRNIKRKNSAGDYLEGAVTHYRLLDYELK